MLRLVGAEALVAADHAAYLQIAARLVDDPGWRRDMGQRIRDGRGALFGRREPAQAFADMLSELR